MGIDDARGQGPFGMQAQKIIVLRDGNAALRSRKGEVAPIALTC